MPDRTERDEKKKRTLITNYLIKSNTYYKSFHFFSYFLCKLIQIVLSMSFDLTFTNRSHSVFNFRA